MLARDCAEVSNLEKYKTFRTYGCVFLTDNRSNCRYSPRHSLGYCQRVVSTAVVSVKRQATGCKTGDMIPVCGIDSSQGGKRTWKN